MPFRCASAIPGRVAFADDLLGRGLQLTGLERGSACAASMPAVAQGAVGVKIWKNIGMALRDAGRQLRDAR